MKRLARKLTSRLDKYQTGQSLVLLAIALVVLIGFTGLVTDISILFVRFSNLRRTVDSAAIAAAGQIREGTDYEAVALAARQFIQLHGLEPHRVWVETCETDIAQWRAGQGAWEGDPHPESNPLYTNPSSMGQTELCNWEAPRKLVRVTAQIESETYFLRLLGLDTITLETSSVSETAVLDVALVLDTSYSMAAATDFPDYSNAADFLPQRGANMPYVIGGASPGSGGIRDECARPDLDGDATAQRRYLGWAPCCNDPGSGQVYQDAGGNWIIYSEVNGIEGYQAGFDTLGNNTHSVDYDYSDLVCNPFRQVKDAARNFVQRLDFVRGDRVTFVAFDRVGRNIVPDGETDEANIMITDEEQALDTLNKYVGVNVSQYTHPPGYVGDFRGDCVENNGPQDDYLPDSVIDNQPPLGVNPLLDRWIAYESVAPCPDTNMGGGIEAGNNALTNAATIRRDAVWVMIVLSDGAATATNPTGEFADPDDHSYGFAGFCPWSTFCNPASGPNNRSGLPVHPECSATIYPTHGFFPPGIPFCNDNNPNTRHFCLQWSPNPDINGLPDLTNPECGPTGGYDADDYARDWADFAGLVNVIDGVPGNFIAIFTIGFGSEIASDNTGAPLLRYIADAGDNGVIDNDLQQDFRDDHVQNGSVSAADLGQPGECEGASSNTEWCGQYYYANNLDELDAVFEAIASRLFTRLSR